mgnify:CR=1 FL=1
MNEKNGEKRSIKEEKKLKKKEAREQGTKKAAPRVFENIK